MKMHVNQVKPVSAMKKYEFLRAQGVAVMEPPGYQLGKVMKGRELDDYIDRAVWVAGHPGKEPEYDIPAK